MRVEGKCPMGCGETLDFLRTSSGMPGRIRCLSPSCPRPLAVHELLNRDLNHRVEITERGFSVEHTLAERLQGTMLGCPLHQYLLALDGPPVKPGRYYATQDGDEWKLEKVER